MVGTGDRWCVLVTVVGFWYYLVGPDDSGRS